MSSHERAVLARRVGLDANCDNDTLAAFITAELASNRAERNRLKAQAIQAAAKRHGYNDADDRVVPLDHDHYRSELPMNHYDGLFG